MAVGPAAFDRYRQSPNEKTTLLRLIIGSVIIAALWLTSTVLVIFGGVYVNARVGPFFGPENLTFSDDLIGNFMASPLGVLATLLTFAGIWIGVWVVMKLIHRERPARLLGNSAGISRSGFLKGFVAVLLTSVLAELVMYWIWPEVTLGSIGLSSWLLFLLPVALFAFVQTSAEEILFRGYLVRGLAYRFRSPLIWALLPTLIFTSLHCSPEVSLTMNIGVFVSIGAFAVLLLALVYVTGNLGAAMGAHLGNNLTGFLLVSHENSLSSFAYFRGPPVEGLTSTTGGMVLVVAISIAAVLLALVLLVHPRSPLKVEVDLGRDRSIPQTNPR